MKSHLFKAVLLSVCAGLAGCHIGGCNAIERTGHAFALLHSGHSTPAMVYKAIRYKDQPTITIAKGTYSSYNFVGGNKYVGADRSGVVINLASQLHFTGDNLSIGSVTFTGAGLLLDHASGMNDNIHLDNVDFKTTTGDCIDFTSGLSNSSFTNCYFTGPGFGNYGYNYNNLTIQGCEYYMLGAGQHIAAFGGCSALVVDKCWFHEIAGMNSEVQGTATNNRLTNCVVSEPRLSTNYNSNLNSFAYSWPLDGSTGTLAEYDVAIDDRIADGTGLRIFYETGGNQSEVRYCYFRGQNVGINCTDGNGNCSVNAHDCQVIMKSGHVTQRDNGPASDLKVTNVGPNVVLPIDLLARGHWVRNVGWSGGTINSGTTTITGTLSESITVQSTLGADGGGVASIAFTNVTGSPTTVKVKAVATGNPADSRGLMAEKTLAYANPLIVGGFAPGYKETITCTLMNGTVTLGTCSAATPSEFPGSSTSTWPPTTQPSGDVAALQAQVATLTKQLADLTAAKTAEDAQVQALTAEKAAAEAKLAAVQKAIGL